MTPPVPPRSALRLAPAIPREDTAMHSEVRQAEPSVPPTRDELVDEQLDALTWDARENLRGFRWLRRRAHRSTRVLLGVSRGVREIRQGQLDDAESRGRLAADVSRALAPTTNRAAAKGGGVVAVLYIVFEFVRLFTGG